MRVVHISSSPPRTEVVFGNDKGIYIDSRSHERVLREIEQAKAEGYDAIRWRDHRVRIDLASIIAENPPNDREAA